MKVPEKAEPPFYRSHVFVCTNQRLGDDPRGSCANKGSVKLRNYMKERAKELILDDHHRMVLLDELNIVLRYDYLPIEEVVAFLRDEKPADKHVVVTGRNAKPELIDIADLVTEMTLVKHPFRAGVKAQKGVEF